MAIVNINNVPPTAVYGKASLLLWTVAFLAFFEGGDARADIDDGSFTGVSDGAVEVADLLFFLHRYEQGC